MNIFYTNADPRLAAYSLDDKRIAKMALESAQILQGAVWNARYGSRVPKKPAADDPPWNLSLSQRNNPCMIWAGSARENYKWLLEHFKVLCFEHTHRYPTKVFFNAYLVAYGYCRDHMEDIPKGTFVEPRPLMLDTFKELRIPTTGKYKVSLAHKYLYTDKRKTTFGNRPVPSFVHNEKVLDYLQRTFGDPVNPDPSTVHRI